MKSDNNKGNFLSDSQIARYWDEGYLFPVSVFSKEEAASYRADLEKIEQDWGASQVLDAVEGILGPVQGQIPRVTGVLGLQFVILIPMCANYH